MTQTSRPDRQQPHPAPSKHAVELLVRFAPRTDPPTGSVRDRNGTEQHFSGWLGLLRLLEEHGPAPAPRRGHNHEEHP